jgi:hypothetical protein
MDDLNPWKVSIVFAILWPILSIIAICTFIWNLITEWY